MSRDTPDTDGFLPPRGNYHVLLTYQKAEVLYDLTYHFCHRFLAQDRRTTDQMIQAARSGKQNIGEGSKFGLTSAEMEIKLTNAGRASLEELLLDYTDFLRVRSAPLWPKDSKEATYVRKLARTSPIVYDTFREICETRPAEVVANIAICLLHQTNYLLDQQLHHLEQEFIKSGGIRERMTRARLEYRNRKPER